MMKMKVRLQFVSCLLLLAVTLNAYGFDVITLKFNNLEKVKNKQVEFLEDGTLSFIGDVEEQKNRDSLVLLKTSDYVSNVCVTQDGDSIIVLPEIIIKVKDKQNIKVIEEAFFNDMYLSVVDNDRICKFKCFARTDDEVLDIYRRLITYTDYFEWCTPNTMIQIKFYNPLYNQQYYLKNTGQNQGTIGVDINVEGAWQLVTGNENIVVSVIDSGVDLTHEDLQDCIIDGYTIGDANGKGAPIDVAQPLVNYDPNHGTACAGIIGAVDNLKGIKGVASGVSILPINIAPFVLYNYYDSYYVAQAIRWAYQRSDVLSCSCGLPYDVNIAAAFNEAMTLGRNGRGSTVVCASGNGGQYSSISFPANLEGVITVGAIDNNGNIWDYSQRGASMDLVAPSGDVSLLGDVVTTDRMGAKGYTIIDDYVYTFGGTSAACPQVAGVVALMLSANPTLTVSQIRNILHETANHIGSTVPNNTYGYGLVDAGAAVAAARDSLVIADGGVIWFNKYNKTNIEASFSATQSPPTPSEGHEIHWRCSSGWTMETDSVASYSRITRTTQTHPSGYIYADFYWNGIKVATSSRNLATTPLGTYHQDACSFYNVYHPAITYHTVEPGGASNYVHQGCTVTMHSSLFKNISVSTVGVTPDYWHHDPTTGYVYFRLPLGSGGIPFVIRSGVYESNPSPSYFFTFFTVSNNGNVMSVNPVGNNIFEVRINSFEDETMQADISSQDFEFLRTLTPEWTMEVYNTNNGNKLSTITIHNYATTLDMNGWPPGSYLIRAVVGNEVYTDKVLVK